MQPEPRMRSRTDETARSASAGGRGGSRESSVQPYASNVRGRFEGRSRRLDNPLQVPLAGQRRQIEIRHAPDLLVVQHEATLDVNAACPTLEIRLAHVRCLRIQLEPEFGSPARVGELDVYEAARDCLLQARDGFLRPQARL